MASYELNTTMPAAGQLFCLVDLDDSDGMGHASETDLTPRTSFPVDPSWYEAYWYSGRSGPTWYRARNTLRHSRSIVRRIAENIAARSKFSVLES